MLIQHSTFNFQLRAQPVKYMANYYTILTGQRPLKISDDAPRATLEQLKDAVLEATTGADATLVRDFFMKFDCLNLVRLLKDPETADLDPRGNLSREQLEELMQGERGTGWDVEQVPDFLKAFAEGYRRKAEAPGYFAEDDVLLQYYDYAMQSKNPDVAAWYRLNFNLQSLMTALVARRNGWKVSDYVRGEGELCDALRTSTAPDFGLGAAMPEVADIVKIADETDPVEKEKRIDAFKWAWLDEHTFFEPFEITALIAFLARTELLDRWALLDVEQGKARFTEIIEGLRGEARVPEEFIRTRV